MPIVIGPGITIGAGIIIGNTVPEATFITTQDNDPLITQDNNNLITEN
jgi:hypothetical protein